MGRGREHNSARKREGIPELGFSGFRQAVSVAVLRNLLLGLRMLGLGRGEGRRKTGLAVETSGILVRACWKPGPGL